MKKKILSLIFGLQIFYGCCCVAHMEKQEQKRFVFIVPSYKNIKWYKKNIDSMIMQDNTYSNWRAIYIDDCSPDGTGPAVAQYVKECGYEHKITVIQNSVRVGALENLYNAIHSCDDDEIVCTLDGDDWASIDSVFPLLNSFYSDEDVWLVYGQYREYPSGTIGLCREIPNRFIYANAFRHFPWVTSHMRTFYAWLFKRIKKEDLMYEGKFFSMTWDLAIMFPMLEMAGERIRFNPTVVYEYNLDNPLNDWKQDLDLMLKLNKYIRHMPKYSRLDRVGMYSFSM
ncbi:glycosyltransferase family 2 protein [bacterium]|nr:glycosyltransferase family 2 protein [bacterium]